MNTHSGLPLRKRGIEGDLIPLHRLRLALALCLLLAPGCGGTKPAAPGGSQTVVVYSPHGKEVLGDYEKLFEAAHPGVDVQMFDMGANDVLNRVRAERDRPAGDVWWGAPSTMFDQATTDGLLDPYKPTWASAIAPEYHDAQDRWYATYLSPLVIVFNDRGLTADAAPKTWDALLEPAWTGKLVLRAPKPSGTMRTFLCAMILRQPDENAGFAWLKLLSAQIATYPESPALLFEHLKRNPDRISVWLLPDIIMQRQLNSYPFGYTVPNPTPVMAEGIAILHGAPHPDLAKQFYEFVTTPEALQQQATKYAKLPARSDLPKDTLPPELSAQTITPMPLDWSRIATQETPWLDRWEKENPR